MSRALWVWELEAGKDYWVTLRDWMLYNASKSLWPEAFLNRELQVGSVLRIKLPGDYNVQG